MRLMLSFQSAVAGPLAVGMESSLSTSSPRRGLVLDKDLAGSSLEDEDMVKVLDRVRSGDRPPQRCLELAQRLLLKKHDQLKRETLLLIEAAAVIAAKDHGQASPTLLVEDPRLKVPTLGSGGEREKDGGGGVVTAAAAAVTGQKKSTATILVSKKTKLPLLLKIK